MGTAARICKELGIGQAEISYHICEQLHSVIFPKNPLGTLHYEKNSPEQLNVEFGLKGVEFKEIQEARPTYPESFEQSAKRAQ